MRKPSAHRALQVRVTEPKPPSEAEKRGEQNPRRGKGHLSNKAINSDGQREREDRLQKSVGRRRRTRSGTRRRRREIEEKCHTHSLAQSLASSVPFQEIAKRRTRTTASASASPISHCLLFGKPSRYLKRAIRLMARTRENYYSKLDIIDLQMDGVILTTL